MELARKVYEVTQSFPEDERYGLVAQLRRASVSVPSNIAEGHARNRSKEFARFLQVARGSLAEVDTQIILAQDLGFVEEQVQKGLYHRIDELQRMLYTLIERQRTDRLSQNSKLRTQNSPKGCVEQ